MVEWIILIVTVVLCIGVLLFRPLPVGTLGSRPSPARDYPEAVRRISALRERDEKRLIPDACVQFMTHGNRTERAIVLVHGYTNCPKQFVKLGEMLFQSGFNVLIPNLPRHGLPDRMTDEQASLTAEELVAYADEAADIAQGLGERVIFAGLSCGGVVSAWAWAFRPDISTAVLMAPAFGFKLLPGILNIPAVNVFSILPNFYFWMNPLKKINGTPEHTYPRFSTRALAQIVRLGEAVRRRAECSIPAGQRLVLITNPNDPDVNNGLMMRIVDRWRRLGASVAAYQFDASWKLVHDFIDPALPNQPVDSTYPLLVKWILGEN